MPAVKEKKESKETTAKSKSFVGYEDDKKLIVQMSKEMWTQLRRLSFELDISMAELCRLGISHILEKNKKALSHKYND